jgi:LCP family protein required for cell wall assembly
VLEKPVSRFFLDNRRLPVLLAALGAGSLLIAGGFILRSSQEQEVQVAVAATQTALVPPTATFTPTNTSTPTATPTATNTPTNTPTGTLPPTNTPTPTATASPTPIPASIVTIDTGGYATPSTPPVTAIPTPVDPIDVPDGVVNIMLLGSDKRPDDAGYRTDTIIIVSINQREGTVNMLSLPRDLFVYIPGSTMARINTADLVGRAVGWPGGGPGMLKETLLYNFGITIHHYARVDFSGFQEIVDTLGAIEVPVDCAIQGYVLKEPRLTAADFTTYQEYIDYTGNEENWEPYTMPVGMQSLDGYMALWYARQRTGSSDFDRARRQQQVLRAIFNQSRSLGLTDALQVPQLWRQYSDLVETDMGLGNMLQLAPLAADLDSSEIQSYILTPDVLTGWQAPGANVFLPNPGAVEQIVTLAMQPPAQNYVINNTASVEVRNGTTVERLDEVAAARIGWEGLNTTPTGPADSTSYGETVIYDFTGSQRGRQLGVLQRVLRVPFDRVITQPDPNRVYDYVVILGQDYQSCTYNIALPFGDTTNGEDDTANGEEVPVDGADDSTGGEGDS